MLGKAEEAGPKAYLNWLVFDRHYKLIASKSGYKRMSTIAAESGQDVAHEKLEGQIEIAEAGYVYIYLSNEEATPVEVFFDDFKVEHTQSPVVQSDEYYPFGLAFGSLKRENNLNQNYLYNNKELQDELLMSWLDYGARMYMPEIARWGVVDPLGEILFNFSPYQYVRDNPVVRFDPNGMYDVYVNGEKLKGKEKRQVQRSLNSSMTQDDPSYTLPDDPSNIDANAWEAYSPEKHAGHTKYWRHKESGAMLAWDEEGGKGSHYHLYKDTRFNDRLDAEGNISETGPGLGKGAKRFHLKSGTKLNLAAISRSLKAVSHLSTAADIIGVVTGQPDSPWAATRGIKLDGTANRAYGLFDKTTPLTPSIYEFSKIGDGAYEVRFYEDYYFDYDYGHWRGSGVVQRKIYVIDKTKNQLLPVEIY